MDVGRGVAGRRARAETLPREPPVHLQQLVTAGAEQRDVQRLLPGAVAQRAHDAGQSLRTLSRGGNDFPRLYIDTRVLAFSCYLSGLWLATH